MRISQTLSAPFFEQTLYFIPMYFISVLFSYSSSRTDPKWTTNLIMFQLESNLEQVSPSLNQGSLLPRQFTLVPAMKP